MAIYVDDMQRHARVGRLNAVWSHLMSDLPGRNGTRELLAFGRRLGLNPAHIQHKGQPTEHFDVTEPKRQQALRFGAIPIRYMVEGGHLTRAKRDGTPFDLQAIRATKPLRPPIPEP